MHYKLKATKLRKNQYWQDIVVKQVQLYDDEWKRVKNEKITEELLEKLMAGKIVMDHIIEWEKGLF